MESRKIIGLMACDPRGVIGKDGGLPWSYPEELEHFCATTHRQVMIMGRKTFESTPKRILQDRLSIVFSKRYKDSFPINDRLIWVLSLEEFRTLSLPLTQKIFMIGGGEIAKLFLTEGIISEFILTKIHKPYEGDTFFPLDLLHNWSQTILRQENDFTIYSHKKN